MKQDRFLMIILGVIGLLIVAALVLFFVRQEDQSYGDDSTPEGTVRNYVIALQIGDYDKAYGYLQEAEEMPNLTEFRQAFLTQELMVTRASVQIQQINQEEDETVINLILNHGGGAPFESSWRENANAYLVLQDGAWKIASMPYPYWYWDWYTFNPIR